MKQTESHKDWVSWVILAVGISVSVAAWLCWLEIGMHFARERVVKKSEPALPSVTTAKSPDLSDASAPPEPKDDRAQLFAELGQTGDAFGALNALVTAIAGALVAWAGYLQYQSLKQARRQADEERAHRKRQEFESLFFQLMQLSAAVTERIHRHGDPPPNTVMTADLVHELPPYTGTAALERFAKEIYDGVTTSCDTAQLFDALRHYFLIKVYDRSPSAFGPYFRLLFQTFKHVSESGLPEEEQIRYSNIARGQISEGAVLLLALNGLSYDGYRFISLIEEFGLLEHLDRRYCLAYQAALEIGFRPRAFMGSVERAKPENAWAEQPKLKLGDFEDLEAVRRNMKRRGSIPDG